MQRPLRVVSILACLAVLSGADGDGTPHVAEGPILLHADINQQWGGHTFAYLLEGERSLFWSATAYSPGEKTWTALVGQYPKPGSGAAPAVTQIPFAGKDVKNTNQPLLLRSNDGFIHVFVGVSHATENPGYAPGTLRYYRGAAPEDITQLVDRTALIPGDPPYNRFHLRMNAGISRDGQRAALVVLAISPDNSVPFNTPVVFFADKRGPDFVFRKPVAYAEPMGFFYPQVALTDAGTVLVGQVWDDAARSITRLLHLDDGGKMIHRADLPAAHDGNYWCGDLRPASGDDRSRLILYYSKVPKDTSDCRHELWQYEPASKALRMLRSIPTPYGAANSGKWIPVSPARSVFLNNPSMGRFQAWAGDLLGPGDVTQVPLTATDPGLCGLAGTAYTFVPNPLQGSLVHPGDTWFAVDGIPRHKDPKGRGPCAFLLYRLACGERMLPRRVP